jgi:4-hydroxybenzoate polyprenyltransferase
LQQLKNQYDLQFMDTLFKRIGSYFSLVRFSHTIFAMPFAIIGFAQAVSEKEYSFSLRLLLLIIICMIFARNAAMGFNRLADKKFDSLNPRTDTREIPAGKVSPKAAAVFVIINSILFIITAGFINRLTLLLSPVALMVILGYSLTKRITYLCHFILGLGLSLAPIGAYISVTGKFSLVAVIYSLIVLTWVSGFDIVYALLDEEFDKNNNLYSIPSVAGKKKAIFFSIVVHIITIFLVIAAGIAGNGGFMFWIGAAVFSALLVFQHLIVKPDDLKRLNLAFQTTNGYASILFALFVILDMVIK